MIVVRCAVLAVDGDVHLVSARDEAQAVDDEADLSVAGELARLSSLDIRIGPVTADAVRTEQRRRRRRSPRAADALAPASG